MHSPVQCFPPREPTLSAQANTIMLLNSPAHAALAETLAIGMLHLDVRSCGGLNVSIGAGGGEGRNWLVLAQAHLQR